VYKRFVISHGVLVTVADLEILEGGFQLKAKKGYNLLLSVFIAL